MIDDTNTTASPARARLAEILANPPPVHAGARRGVWLTDASCYEFLADRLTPDMRTLETGLGVSTAVFALAGCEHMSVFLDRSEGEALLAYCREHDIRTDRVILKAGPSDAILPALTPDELDLVMIDGSHAYPFPQIDWYYAGGRLRQGGIVVVDDVRLHAPRQLQNYLDADPRWEQVAGGGNWTAYRRLQSGILREEWVDQGFAVPLGQRLRTLAGRVRRQVEPLLKRR